MRLHHVPQRYRLLWLQRRTSRPPRHPATSHPRPCAPPRPPAQPRLRPCASPRPLSRQRREQPPFLPHSLTSSGRVKTPPLRHPTPPRPMLFAWSHHLSLQRSEAPPPPSHPLASRGRVGISRRLLPADPRAAPPLSNALQARGERRAPMRHGRSGGSTRRDSRSVSPPRHPRNSTEEQPPHPT